MRREIFRICYKYDGYGHLIGMYLAGEDLSALPGGISGVFLGNALWCISSYDGQNTEEILGDTIRRTTALNAYGYPQQVKMMRGNSTLRQMNYLYNAVTGNLTQRTSLFLSDDIEYYSYDTADRLTEWHKDSHTTPMVMTYTENGNIYTKTNVGQYSYGYDWHHAFAVESVTNAQSLIPSSALSTQFDGREMVSSIYEYGSWKETTFTYGPDGERWEMTIERPGEYEEYRNYLGDMEVTLSGPGMTRCNWYLGHGVMLFRDADNPAFSSVTPLYAYRDNQGSYIDFFRSNGTRVFEAKYDPWGVETVVRDSISFHRGYGGHEMLNEFGIINMNGRLYDPLLGRFLSPDNYVQEPFNTQNLNRYSYCLNNPVKHTDPSGNFHLPSFLKFWKGALLINSVVNLFKHGINLSTWNMNMVKNAVKITASTIQGTKGQILNKWTWNYWLTKWGHDFTQMLNMTGLVKDVTHMDGAVAISGIAKKDEAFTFGHYIFGPRKFRADWRDHLFVHEYGHYVQAQRMGLFYIPVVAYPSVVNYGMGAAKIFGPSNHSERWYEVHASRLGAKHFDRHYGRGATGYEKDNPKYFDMESFSEGTLSKYLNPRTGIVNDSYHPIYHHRQSPWDYFVPFTLFDINL